ncbi:MAG: hypothetical protein ACHP6H_01295 [Legionellales bacterium]
MDSMCKTFTIQDWSNYATNTENACLEADFNAYRFIVITHQSGNSVTLSTQATSPYLIPAPSTGSNVFSTPVFNGDGVYYFDLYTVPTYDASASYTALVHCVYYNGVLYLASQDSTDQTPSSSSTYWTVITQAQIPSKYFDEAYVGVACATKTCMDSVIQNAICNFSCNPIELCSNPCFLAARKITLLYYNIQEALNTGNVNAAENFFNQCATICNDCKPCTQPCS